MVVFLAYAQCFGKLCVMCETKSKEDEEASAFSTPYTIIIITRRPTRYCYGINNKSNVQSSPMPGTEWKGSNTTTPASRTSQWLSGSTRSGEAAHLIPRGVVGLGCACVGACVSPKARPRLLGSPPAFERAVGAGVQLG